jgi:hypothetical protein
MIIYGGSIAYYNFFARHKPQHKSAGGVFARQRDFAA